MSHSDNIILPEIYTADKLISIYIEAEHKVNPKAEHYRQHFSGFSLAYAFVTCFLCICDLFVNKGFLQKAHDLIVCDNFLLWFLGFEYIVHVDKIFVFLCRKIGVYTDNPFNTKEFFSLLSMALFAEELKKDPDIEIKHIEYTIRDNGVSLVEFGGICRRLPSADYRWIDTEAKRIIKKYQ